MPIAMLKGHLSQSNSLKTLPTANIHQRSFSSVKTNHLQLKATKATEMVVDLRRSPSPPPAVCVHWLGACRDRQSYLGLHLDWTALLTLLNSTWRGRAGYISSGGWAPSTSAANSSLCSTSLSWSIKPWWLESCPAKNLSLIDRISADIHLVSVNSEHRWSQV